MVVEPALTTVKIQKAWSVTSWPSAGAMRRLLAGLAVGSFLVAMLKKPFCRPR
jgi:hypothetical protein